MNAVKSIWIARLFGETADGEVKSSLEFNDGQVMKHKYKIADFSHNNGKFSPAKNLNKCHLKFESITYQAGKI